MDLGLITSALPNPHAAVVHFPVALLLTAIALDLACLIFRRHIWIDRASTALTVAGSLALAAAYLTGGWAVESLAPVTGIAQGVLADHEDLALISLGAWALATALRGFVSWLGRDDRRIHLGVYRLAALLLSLFAAGLLVLTAAHGGTLVYQHGVGVATTSAPAESD